MSFIFNGGVLDKAELAVFETRKSQARESIEMVLLDAVVEKNTEEEYNENEYLDDFIHESDDSIRVVDDTIEKDGFLFELDRSVPKIGEFIREITDPIIDDIKVIEKTTNSVTVEVVSRDDDEATYTYWIKKNSDGEDAWKEVYSGQDKTCKFEDLEDNVLYDIKVKIENFRGETERIIHTQTNEMPSGTIEFSDLKWDGGNASIVVTTTEDDFTLQYQVNGTEDDGWTDIENGGTIENLEFEDEVYARLWDGNNGSEHSYIKIEDNEPPKEFEISASNVSATGFTINASTVDEQSGMNRYEYYVEGENKGTNNVITGLATGTYSVYVIAYDNAGNSRQSNTISVTTNIAPNTPAVTYTGKTTSSISVSATATDENDGQNITYTLYTSTSQNGSYTSAASQTVAEGTTVNLTASGLSEYTTYYYYVDVSDGVANTPSSTSNVRTYCSGRTYSCRPTRCRGGGSSRCSRCGGSGKVKCTGTPTVYRSDRVTCSCGNTNAAHTYYRCPICRTTGDGGINCSACGRYDPGTNNHASATIDCSSCSEGYITYTCSHGRTSSHYYCSHYTSTSSSTHYYCAHNMNGVQHD